MHGTGRAYQVAAQVVLANSILEDWSAFPGLPFKKWHSTRVQGLLEQHAQKDGEGSH